jgi:hypothetical protein
VTVELAAARSVYLRKVITLAEKVDNMFDLKSRDTEPKLRFLI